MRHLGAAVKGYRLEQNLSQAALADRAKVSRQWVVAFEAGKPTAEVGSVLRTVAALGYVLDLVPATPSSGDVDISAMLDG